MRTQNIVHPLRSGWGAELLADVSAHALRYKAVRLPLMSYADWRIRRRLRLAPEISDQRPPRVTQDKASMIRALACSIDRAMALGCVSKPVVKGMLRGLVMNAFLHKEHRAALERFRQGHDGYGPPGFLVIGPGKLCNLQCKGCYASSGTDTEKLDWEVFDRIITEAKTLWGSGFVVITGGEPLAYQSQGKGVLDAAAKHQDAFFLMYTNGTLIDREVAARIAEVGNLTPAISVEGWEPRTDARRGQGTYQKVLRAMSNLRRVGVPFGISLTVTCENCEEILSDKFLQFFFERQGAAYGWMFQYMPIGRGFTLKLLPTPEQRAWMWERTWQVVHQKRYFLADFWNFGPCSNGCIAAGRQGGYLYIDWNGKVMPCVFVPYSPVNINDAYREGKTLNDILEEPFFKAIREWQDAYGYVATQPKDHHNWLMPCINRDHHCDFRRILEATGSEPEDEAALQAMTDPTYREGLIQYDQALAQVMDPLWEKEYLSHNGREAETLKSA